MLIEIDLRRPLDGANEGESEWGQSPITIQVDNQGTLDLATNSKHHDRTKHIDIRHHFIRETINRGYVSLVWVPSAEQTADIFTKPLLRTLFEEHQRRMGVVAKGGYNGP